jgi:peptidoglycan/LPS O-acetylase OafA/YrhL
MRGHRAAPRQQRCRTFPVRGPLSSDAWSSALTCTLAAGAADTPLPALPRRQPTAGVFFVSSRIFKTQVAPAYARFYRPELDLLRFLAFLMVWCAHASLALRGLVPAKAVAWVNGVGSLGVPVFFFLSAYLITELLRRERAQTGSIDIRKFYIRRVLRIWPLYFGILVAYALLGIWFHGFRIEPGRLLASCLMVGNWYIGHHPGLTTPLRHLWSISVEEQWYLLWPLLALGLPRRLLLPGCAVIFCVSQYVLIGFAHAAAEPNAVWVSSGVQAQYLAEGAATALVLGGRIPRLRRLPCRSRCLRDPAA